MVAVELLVTVLVVTANVALVAPDWTVTFGGTLATDALVLARLTVRPPAGAALVRFIVP
jgi:hypothetical protein